MLALYIVFHANAVLVCGSIRGSAAGKRQNLRAVNGFGVQHPEPADQIVRHLDDSNFDASLADRAEFFGRQVAIRDEMIDRGDWDNSSKASAIELAGIADRDHFLRSHHHGAIHSRFKHIWRGKTDLDVKTVNAKKHDVGVYFLKQVFGERSDGRERVPAQRAANLNDLGVALRQIRSDVQSIGDDGQVLE
jgi:hypothetical protein